MSSLLQRTCGAIRRVDSSKHAHGKAVPTWNYVVAQGRGTSRFVHEGDRMLAHVNELTDAHGAGQHLPWKVSDAPADFPNACWSRSSRGQARASLQSAHERLLD